MRTLFRTSAARDLVVQEGPAFIASLVIAELLYKFHSFTLEVIAFLATWYALSALTHALGARLRGRPVRRERER